MKTIVIKLTVLLFVTLAMFACSKDSTRPGSSAPPPPVKTGKGTPSGTAVTKSIGPNGGKIVSSDGKLTVTVEAGTVNANTNFSIQPILSVLPGRDGRPAYRLLPEGSAFNKRITVTYRYDSADLAGSLPDLLTVTYQQEDGTWKAVPAAVNKPARTVTFTTDHFSDWQIHTLVELMPDQPEVSLHSQVDFKVKGFFLDVDDLLGPIEPANEYSGVIKWAGNWKVLSKGKGIIAGHVDTPLVATYRPPSPLVHGTMDTVQVEIKGTIMIPDTTAPGGNRRFEQMILLSQVRQVNETFIAGKFDGNVIDGTDVQIAGSSGQIIMNANMTNDTSSMHYSVQVSGASKGGEYPCGDLLLPGNAEVNAIGEINDQPKLYTSSYLHCGPPVSTRYSSARVVIDNWGPVGTYISGSFSGTVYKVPDDCSPPGKSLTFKFRAKRVY